MDILLRTVFSWNLLIRMLTSPTVITHVREEFFKRDEERVIPRGRYADTLDIHEEIIRISSEKRSLPGCSITLLTRLPDRI